MSRAKKIALLVSAGCIGAGLLLMLAAMIGIGFRFDSLSTQHFETVTHEVEQPFERIEIRDLECDVRLLPAEDGQCRVLCSESEGIVTRVEVHDGVLQITRTDTRPWYAHIGIWFGTDLTLNVYLPETEYRSLFLHTVSGDIAVEGFRFEEVDLKSVSGDVTCDTVKVGGSFEVHSTSGDLRLRAIQAGASQIKTVSGTVSWADGAASSLQIESTSGDLRLEAVIAAGEMNLKTVSGDIKLNGADAATLQIKSTSGDVKGQLLTPKNFISKTTSGGVQLPPSDPSAGTCEIKTVSGDIKLN